MSRWSIALVAVLVLACGDSITEGEIYQLVHEPERTWIALIPITTCVGKPVICTTTMIPVIHYDDEDWVVSVRQWSDEKGRFLTASFYVPQTVYSELHEGQWFAMCDSCESDDPVRQERQ